MATPCSSGLRTVLWAALAVVAATGLYLVGLTLFEIISQQPWQNPFTFWMLLVHVLVGLVLFIPILALGLWSLKKAFASTNRGSLARTLGWFVAFLATGLTGIALCQFDGLPRLPTNTLSREIVYTLHLASPLIALALFLLPRWKENGLPRRRALGWSGGIALLVLGMFYLHAHESPVIAGKASDGAVHFDPSRSRTATGKFIPASAMMMDEYCKGCHQDAYEKHRQSVHHFSSFNNPVYLFSAKETWHRMGVRALRWCAGCHDPVPFFSGALEDPQYDVTHHPTAHAGITCIVCHSITHINSLSGNGDYTVAEPPHYPFATSDNPVLQWVNNQLIKASPSFHKQTFLKPVHRSADFCATCHKVRLPQDVNHYKESLPGQNHGDSHLLSGASGHGARAFYNPPVAKPGCAECHMPLVESRDFGSRDYDRSGIGKIHSHLFPGANTGVPALVRYPGHEKLIEAHRKFLQEGLDGKSPAMRIDLFGLKQLSIDTAQGVSLAVGLPSTGDAMSPLGPSLMLQLMADPGVKATLIDDHPLRPGLPGLRPGASYLVEAVIRTLNIGHHFTQGTIDSNEVWVEFTARAGGRIIGRSGHTEGGPDKGRVDPWAHFVNGLVLDRNGNRIDRHNPQDIFTPLYDHQIPPGASQVVHYRLNVPRDIRDPIELSARVRYRKFDITYMEHLYGKDKAPVLPIIDLCSDRVVLPVAGVAGKVPEQLSPVPAWERWNDYGIACFLEGGPEGKKGGERHQAEKAFARLVSPEFKAAKQAHAHGYLNLARVYLAMGGRQNLDKARQALEQARACDPPAPWWTVAWFKGLIDVQNADLDAAINHFRTILNPEHRDPRRKQDFTRDYIVINELGKTLFLAALREESASRATAERLLLQAVEQFERTLQLDPEFFEAHEFLNKCYGRLAKEEKSSVALPPSLQGEEGRLLALARTLAAEKETVLHRQGAARALIKALDSQKSLARLPVLMALHRQIATMISTTGDAWLRLAATPVFTALDRHILATFPELGRKFTLGQAGRSERLEAGDQLAEAILQLNIRPPQAEIQPVFVSLSAFPAPGLPANMALASLADKGYLHGPFPATRVSTLENLRQQMRPMFAGQADDEIRGTAARILSRIYLLLHYIHRPDEYAEGRAKGIYRRRHPEADQAANAIVIYSLHQGPKHP